MPDIIIKSEKEEEKPVQDSDIKKTLEAADEYERLKVQNDLFEKEIQRREELKAKLMIGGKADAGQYTPEKSPEEKTKEEASKILEMFK